MPITQETKSRYKHDAVNKSGNIFKITSNCRQIIF